MAREQILDFEGIRLTATDAGDREVLFYLAGKRLYEVGDQSADYPPQGWRRPGFLVGRKLTETIEPERPFVAAHLMQEMGGIWAHPIKGIEDLYFSISDEQSTRILKDCTRFENHLAYADMFFELGDYQVVRRDFVVEDSPALFTLVRIKNKTGHARNIKLNLTVRVNIIPSWFSGFSKGEDRLFYADGRIVAYDSLVRNQWGLVFGTNERPEGHRFAVYERLNTGTLTYRVDLDANEERSFTFLHVIDHQEGYPGAIQTFDTVFGQSEKLLEEKKSVYHNSVFEGVRFHCPDSWFEKAFYLAKANLVMLTAEPVPYLSKYLFAGVPEYVQLFGCDTAYSVPGLMSVGYGDLAGEALLQLAKFGRELCGRIPHEVTTNGRVFHPGNTQETPQFAIAAWNYFKWTGDRVFLEEVYPLCQEGVMSYVPAHWDLDLDFYPDGNAMVERLGMGSEKLDSICYFCKAIYCLADMAGALGWVEARESHLKLADDLRTAINADWWIAEEGLYADSLNDDHTQRQDGHWTVAVPMETELAPPDRAIQSLERIEREWIEKKWGDEWGMVHTREKELFVWTLPTGVLAMSEFAYRSPEVATKLLRGIALTLKNGTLGSYKELVPEGLSFFQLWSPAMFLQGAVEGLFGVDPRAHEDLVRICPRVPQDWAHASVEGLKVGEREIGIWVEQGNGKKVRVAYQAGHGVLKCEVMLAVNGEPTVRRKTRNAFEVKPGEHNGRRVLLVEFALEPNQVAAIAYRNGQVALELLKNVTL